MHCWAKEYNGTAGSLHGSTASPHLCCSISSCGDVCSGLKKTCCLCCWRVAGEQHPKLSSRSCYLRLARGSFKFIVIKWNHWRFIKYGFSSCAAVIHGPISSFCAWQILHQQERFFSITLKPLWASSDISAPSEVGSLVRERMLGYLAICGCGNRVV